jgi:hypothetical protein
LAARGIIKGRSEALFAPAETITRAEFIKLVMETFNLVDAQAESSFKDVIKGEWYYQAVASAQKLGITSGIDEFHFGTGEQISRQDMAVMIYRAAEIAGIKLAQVKAPFAYNDASGIGDYAMESVNVMQAAGVIEGMDGGLFAPRGQATREQAAKMLDILYKMM